MRKVVVDLELLESVCDVVDSLECASGFALGSCEELRELLAQPAEAEGVEVVCYLRATQDGKPEWSEDCVCEDAVYPNYEGDETFSMPMVRQSDHLAALSAVTAERDQSISLTADYIAMLGEAGVQIDQLHAEVEALQIALRLSANRIDRLAIEFEQGTPMRWTATEWAEEARAALAAKEA